MCKAQNSYKQITLANWTKPDPVNRVFVRIQEDGTSRTIKSEEYLTEILSHRLNDWVPEDIHQLHEVTRGSMTYGYYYYPIFTFATEQLFRILESSVSHVCKTLGCPASKNTFNKKIEWLTDKRIIQGDEKIRWDSIRKLRNLRSHPKNQMILTPGNAIRFLAAITDEINSLFQKMSEYQKAIQSNTEPTGPAEG